MIENFHNAELKWWNYQLITHLSLNNKWSLLIRINYHRTLKYIRYDFLHEQTTERPKEISFRRLFVCRIVQYAKTTNGMSFTRLPKRTNDGTFVAFQKHDGTTKRQSYRDILKFDLSWLLVHFFVCSLYRIQQGTKTTERQCDKNKFYGHFVLSFVRFVALYKSPKRRNEISSFFTETF